jgi:hypothetical protein
MYEWLSGMGTNGEEAARALERQDFAAAAQAVMQAAEAERAQNPELYAIRGIPLCALIELLPGAIIGAIASPKGERWGGAKWGSLAAASTCLLGVPLARLGVAGSTARWIAGFVAPIVAAKWRLGWRP